MSEYGSKILFQPKLIGGRKMIDNFNTIRIRDDAYIACDALQSLINSPRLHENYIREKLDVVRRCIKFIENFEAKDDDK